MFWNARVAHGKPSQGPPGNAAERLAMAEAEHAKNRAERAVVEAVDRSRAEARPVWPALAFPWTVDADELGDMQRRANA